MINKQRYVEYRAVFFDHDYEEIDRSPWKYKALAADVPDNVTIVSTNPQPQSFQVHFRYRPSAEYRERLRARPFA